MDDTFRGDRLQRLQDCARAYALHASGISINEIGRCFGSKAASARLMIERGALLEGRVVVDFSDETPMCHLPLPTRIAKVLSAMEITTVGQARATRDEIYLRRPGFGPKALTTLRAVLASRA